jgi:hypothetical protein
MNKRVLSTSLKIVVSGVLLSLIVKKAGPEQVLQYLYSMKTGFFLLSTLIYVVIAWLVAIRWNILLGSRYTVGKLFSLHMIGNFFNTILPGNLGGDAVKGYYLYRDTNEAGVSFGSVFLDRYLGLFARLFLGLVSGMAAFAELRTIGMHWTIPALFSLFIAGSLLVFRFRIGKRFGAIADFYDYIHSLLKQKPVLLKAFLLSLIIQVLLIVMIAAVALGIGEQLSFTELFVFVPIIMTAMIIPLSISGFGVREGAFVVLFGLTGIPPSISVSISFLWFLSTATASLIGLVEYLRFRKKISGPEQSSKP